MKTGKIKTIYRFLNYILVNIFILFIALNLIESIYYNIRHSWIRDLLKPYFKKAQGEKLLEAYEGIYSVREIFEIRKEIYENVKFQYQPWVQFTEGPCTGKHINIVKDGYRLNAKEPREVAEDAATIFVFGGSTVWGFRIADSHTIPAYLERKLPNTRVVNYGRMTYYSSQEMTLFLTLLRNGNIPDIAIFLDGINEVRTVRKRDEPEFSYILEELFSKKYYIDYNIIPALRLTNRIWKMLRKIIPQKTAAVYDTDEKSIKKTADKILHNYRQNIELIKFIADKYGVKVYFFWQPMPFYAYNLENHSFLTTEYFSEKNLRDYRHRLYNKVYQTMEYDTPEGVIFLADIFKNKKHTYIDPWHYSPLSCEMLAQKIAETVRADMQMNQYKDSDFVDKKIE
jgi:hypothetical protein